MSNNLIKIKNINKTFRSGRNVVVANNNVSFNIKEGEVVGLIGESGSGKTTLGRVLMNLYSPDSGEIYYKDRLISGSKLTKRQKKYLYNNVQMIFQDPYSTLNSQKNIFTIVSESLRVKKIDNQMLDDFLENREQVLLFNEFLLKESFYKKYWAYRIFSNKVAVEGLKTIAEKLKTFKTNNEKTMTENFDVFMRKTYDIKDVANFKIISKLDELILHTLTIWSQAQKRTKTGKMSHKYEIKLAHWQKLYNEAHKELKVSDEQVRIVENKTKANKNFETAKEQLIIDKRQYLSKNKNQVKNAKLLLISLKNKKYESLSREDYDYFSKKIIETTEKIKKLKVEKTGKLIEFDELKESIKLDYENSIIYLNEKLKEETAEHRNLDVKALRKKMKGYKENIKKYQLLFDEAKEKYVRTVKEKLISDEERYSKQIEKNIEEIEEYRKYIIPREKEIIEEIISESKSNTDEFKTRKLNAKHIKTLFRESVSRNVQLEKEIAINFKQLNTLKQVLNIFDITSANNIDKKTAIKDVNKKAIKKILLREEVFETLEKVGLNRGAAFRYPHEFSGGMRQRVGIARALISKPKLIIADEPIAALDLSIQAQIVNLLMELKEKEKISLLFIAHDLSMIEYNSDYVVIMHQGRIVEKGLTKEIFKKPVHPYTKNLMDSIPTLEDINKPFIEKTFVPDYLKEYSNNIIPSYFNVSKTHEVLGIKEQIDEWKKQTKKIK